MGMCNYKGKQKAAAISLADKSWTINSTKIRHLGLSNLWAILIIPVLISFAGLSVDIGYLVWVGQQLQIGADAAALAGVPYVRNDTGLTRDKAVEIGALNIAVNTPLQLDRNDGNSVSGDIVIGHFDQDTDIFDETAPHPNAVKVMARRTNTSLNGPVPLQFARIFGVNTREVERMAIAMIGGGTGAGLIVLNETERKALEVGGNVYVQINGGAVQVNSSDLQAGYFNGNITIDGSELNVVGDIQAVGGPVLPSDYNSGVEPLDDPLAFLEPPTWDPAADLGTVGVLGGESLTLQPGYYSGGIAINNGTLTLEPGIYVLDGVGLEVLGGDFYAEGVMFYIINTGAVNIGGNGMVRITPPESGVYEGVSIFQARDNTNSGRIIGTSVMDLEGTYYFPSNHMELGGDAQKFGNQFVVDTLYIHGNGQLTINYDGRFSAPGNEIFLVR